MFERAVSGIGRATSNVDSYDALASWEWREEDRSSCGEFLSTGCFSRVASASATAVAIAASFFEAFPRFLRSRAYSQLNPNSRKFSATAITIKLSQITYQHSVHRAVDHHIWCGAGYTGHKHG